MPMATACCRRSKSYPATGRGTVRVIVDGTVYVDLNEGPRSVEGNTKDQRYDDEEEDEEERVYALERRREG